MAHELEFTPIGLQYTSKGWAAAGRSPNDDPHDRFAGWAVCVENDGLVGFTVGFKYRLLRDTHAAGMGYVVAIGGHGQQCLFPADRFVTDREQGLPDRPFDEPGDMGQEMFSPGEWAAVAQTFGADDGDDRGIEITACGEDSGEMVCVVEGGGPNGPGNAALIAAAPRLYAACLSAIRAMAAVAPSDKVAVAMRLCLDAVREADDASDLYGAMWP